MLRGGREDDQSRRKFDGWGKTRVGGPLARYIQKWQKTAADKTTGHIGGGGQGCRRHSEINGDRDSDRSDRDNRRRMGGYSCDGVGIKDTPAVSTRLRLR